MIETFFGDWSVEVLTKDAAFDERFIIGGSDSSDGVYPGIPGTVLERVTGTEWRLTMEWNNNRGSGWQPSDIQRTATFTIQEGLVIRLGADDDTPTARDFDFNDMVVVCKSLDLTLNPPPIRNPYDFSIPEEVRVQEPYPQEPCPEDPYSGS
jgi:hypothetical protein